MYSCPIYILQYHALKMYLCIIQHQSTNLCRQVSSIKCKLRCCFTLKMAQNPPLKALKQLYDWEKQYQALESKLNKFVTSLSPARHYSLSCSKLDQFIFKSLIHVPSNTTALVKGSNHGITKYGIHSLTQIVLAIDKELTNLSLIHI